MNQFINATPSEYHAIKALSGSRIKKTVETTPLHAETQVFKATKAMDYGSIAHALALGVGDFVISPYDEFRTNEAKAWRDSQVAPIIKAKDLEEAEAFGKSIREVINGLTAGNKWEPEVPFTWSMETAAGDIDCKAMADIWCPGQATIYDIKIASKGVSNDHVERYFNDNGCAIQSRFYRTGLGKVLPELEGRIKFKTILFETSAPFSHRVAVNTGAYDVLADSQISYAAHHYAVGVHTGFWLGYPTDEFMVSPKPWAMERWLEDEVAESI